MPCSALVVVGGPLAGSRARGVFTGADRDVRWRAPTSGVEHVVCDGLVRCGLLAHINEGDSQCAEVLAQLDDALASLGADRSGVLKLECFLADRGDGVDLGDHHRQPLTWALWVDQHSVVSNRHSASPPPRGHRGTPRAFALGCGDGGDTRNARAHRENLRGRADVAVLTDVSGHGEGDTELRGDDPRAK